MDSTNIPKKGRYRHFKGNEYELLDIAIFEETLEPLVIYRALYGDGKVWARKLSVWNETVEKDGVQVSRFEYIGDM
ncbi:MAG: DUF1653 domain-containing protein [Ruminococcaceae bacterium]|nr:DUF1653 domain-containing protein [Oscillospiraceae bacterium]